MIQTAKCKGWESQQQERLPVTSHLGRLGRDTRDPPSVFPFDADTSQCDGPAYIRGLLASVKTLWKQHEWKACLLSESNLSQADNEASSSQ